MKENHVEENVRDQRQDQYHKFKYEPGEEHWSGKYSNFVSTSNPNLRNNNSIIGHVDDNAMGNLSVMSSQKIQGPIVNTFGI